MTGRSERVRRLPSCGAAKEWYVLQLASHAQVLSEQRHHDQAHQIDRPPATWDAGRACAGRAAAGRAVARRVRTTRDHTQQQQQHAAARSSTQHAARSTSTRTRTAPHPQHEHEHPHPHRTRTAPAAPAPVAPAQHQRHHQPPPTHPPPAPRISTGRRHGRTTPSWRGSHRTLHRSRGVAGGRSS